MPALSEVPKRKSLQSWKEIAAFLNVTVRSVQRWEKESGLPVYRQGNGIKARVFAYSDELQRWLESSGMPEVEESVKPESGRASWMVYLGVAVIIVAAIGGIVIFWRSGVIPLTRIPQDWRLNGSDLSILDAQGRLCWEKKFPPFDVEYDVTTVDKALVADIDDDGRPEVLVNFLPQNLGAKGGSILCYEHDGRQRWEYTYGGSKIFGSRTFEPSYRGRFIRLVRDAGKPLILTIANHYIWYPAQAALLDPKTGRVMEDYWHPGWIYRCEMHDIDHDGADEAILGAINNPGSGLGHAALAALKIPFSKAPHLAAPLNNPFPPMTGGGELAYALFPLPDVCRTMGSIPGIARLAIDPYDRILVELPLPENGGIVYYLDTNFRVLEYHLSDNFAALHDRYYRQGLLDHPLTEEETTSLGKIVPFAAAPDGNSPALKQFWKF